MNPAALCNIAGNLTRTVEHAREKRSHKLAWVMAFQPCRLISNISIGGGMRFIEGVRCKGGHLIKELVGNFFIHAPLDCSLTLHRAILMYQSIYEIFALLLHDLMLLFGHGAAHNIRAAIGVARQLAEDLHHLLLIDHTAVGDIQNILQQRRFIAHPIRVMAIFNIGWDRFHRPGPIEGNYGDQSSKLSGFRPIRTLRMPADSNWKTPSVCPLANISYTASSFVGI